VGNVAGYPVVLLVGLVMLVYGSTRKAKGFGKVTALIGAVYNGVSGYFSDILSYARLMALMLATSVIAMVFNTLAALPHIFIVFLIIFIVGHVFNIGVNLIGTYVHAARLQYLEYYSKFYKDGGRFFAPLKYNTKYVDIDEEEN
jgi:V/A-type H+-transporting ATPase subunit I